MAGRYEVRVKDTVGALVAVITDWRSLTYTKRVNDIGTLYMEINGNSPVVELFTTDCFIEVRRRDPQNDVDWYVDWIGFHRAEQFETTIDKDQIYSFYAFSLVGLCARRIIAYPANSAQSTKSGLGEAVIKEFVTENLGPSLAGNRHGTAVAMPYFLVEADQGRGIFWEGARAYDNVFTVIQGIANEQSLFFDIESEQPPYMVFKVYEGQRGTDRSRVGLDETTGLNAAGNSPVVFSLAAGNVEDFLNSIDRRQEANAIFVLGQGLEDDRVVVERTDPVAIADSLWNRVEASVNANRETTVAALNAIGDRELAVRQKSVNFYFTPLQIPSYVLGRDYFWGDLVTARYEETEYDIQIIKQTIQTDQNAEKIDFALSTVVNNA